MNMPHGLYKPTQKPKTTSLLLLNKKESILKQYAPSSLATLYKTLANGTLLTTVKLPHFGA